MTTNFQEMLDRMKAHPQATQNETEMLDLMGTLHDSIEELQERPTNITNLQYKAGIRENKKLLDALLSRVETSEDVFISHGKHIGALDKRIAALEGTPPPAAPQSITDEEVAVLQAAAGKMGYKNITFLAMAILGGETITVSPHYLAYLEKIETKYIP